MIGPRFVGALALAVLAGAGVAELLIPSHPASLVGQPNWTLAQTLPTQDEFPASWNYSVHGTLGFAGREPSPQRFDPALAPPAPAFSPAECGQLPAVLLAPQPGAVTVHVDHTPVGIAEAELYTPEASAVGRPAGDEPAAEFVITAPTDPATGVEQYRDWLGGCGAYRVHGDDPGTRRRFDRSAATSIETPAPGAALTVTRTFLDDGATRPRQYRVSYFPVRGLLLTVTTSMTGADAGHIDELAAAAARKLAVL